MTAKIDCYVDTSAFIAFLDRSDNAHPFFKRLFAAPPRLMTSTLVIAEGHGWFLRRYDQRRAAQFLAFLDALPSLTVRGFDKAELVRARAVVRSYPDQRLTLADAHGLSLMKELRIADCWSTDWHLGLGGARLIH